MADVAFLDSIASAYRTLLQARPEDLEKVFALLIRELARWHTHFDQEARVVAAVVHELGLAVGLGEKRIQDALDAGFANPFDPSKLAQKATVPRSTAALKTELLLTTAFELQRKTFRPIRYVVPGHIPEGCTILAGRPKVGKSWLMLEVGLAVAGGGVCLGNLQCEQGRVLYLALEDNERRLQTRIEKICGNRTAWPREFAFATLSPRADAGGLQQIRKWIDSAPNPRLVVIDVLTAFRAAAKSRENPYSWDYESLKGLQEIAAETNVAIVVVHHLRKNDGGDDPIDKVSGTLGLTGAADTILILDRKGGAFSLSGRGRDVEEFEVPIVFDKETCRWRLAPDDERPSVSQERSQILQLLLMAPGPMTPKEIAQGTGMQRNNVDQLLFQMVRAGEIQKIGRGRYIHPRTAPPTPATDKINTKIRTSIVTQGHTPDSDTADRISHRSYLHAENDPAAPIDQLITTLANLSPLAGSAEAAPEQPIAPAPSLPPPPDVSSIGNERWQMRISARSSS